jgi:hypothetical protein
MGTLLERYDAGERRRVWGEIHALGPLSLASDEMQRDAAAVARRTMERAVRNLGVLHERLNAGGFRFDLPAYAFVQVGEEHTAALRALVEKVGAVPPTLKALLAAIGDVSFRGWLPARGSANEWRAQLVDPFEFIANVRGEIDRVEDELVAPEDREFRLPIAGDYLHKNDFSGGAETVVPLPSDEADARVVEDDGVWFKEYLENLSKFGLSNEAEALAAAPRPVDKPIWLVDYLRMYFEAGGFRRVAGTTAYPEDFTRPLAEGLLEN